ncbi:MAG: metallopeptidase family protein [Alphaproteobacteria bacterium]
MDARKIIMNFSIPPSIEDIEVLACNAIETLPDELVRVMKTVAVVVEEFPDELLESELELEDPFDLVALYRSGSEIAPGITKKTANDDDVLMIFRRPLLDMWCDSGDDLNTLLTQIVIEELGRNFEFTDDEIDDIVKRHHAGLY